MDGAEFSRALAAGLGRALRDARSVQIEDRRERLFEACIRHRAWDRQQSSNRGRWLARVLEASGDTETLAPRILAELAVVLDTYEFEYDVSQMVELATAFAKRGVTGARDALYAAAERESHSTLGAVHAGIVELDRMAGFEWIARRLGARARESADFGIDDWMVFQAREELGDHDFDAWLERASAVDQDIAAFRERAWPGLEESKQTATQSDEAPSNSVRPWEEGEFWWDFRFADARRRLLDAPQEGQYFYWMSKWARKRANEQDLEDTRGALLLDEDPRVLSGCLRAFQHRTLPRFDPRLLHLLEHEDGQVNGYAHNALSRITDERIRRVAVDRLQAGRCDGDTLMLLRVNFVAGDAERIRCVLPKSGEQWETHDIAFDLIDLLERHATIAETDLLEWCFEWAACENCRDRAVTRLQELDALSPALEDEARYDSNPYVRECIARGPVPIDAPLPPE